MTLSSSPGESKVPDLKLRYVKWVDSHGTGDGWQRLDDITPEQLIVRSIGFVLHETADLIVLVPHLCYPAEDANIARQGRGALTIPKQSIIDSAGVDASEFPL